MVSNISFSSSVNAANFPSFNYNIRHFETLTDFSRFRSFLGAVAAESELPNPDRGWLIKRGKTTAQPHILNYVDALQMCLRAAANTLHLPYLLSPGCFRPRLNSRTSADES